MKLEYYVCICQGCRFKICRILMFALLKIVVIKIIVVICFTIPAQSWLVDTAAIINPSRKTRKKINKKKNAAEWFADFFFFF